MRPDLRGVVGFFESIAIKGKCRGGYAATPVFLDMSLDEAKCIWYAKEELEALMALKTEVVCIDFALSECIDFLNGQIEVMKIQKLRMQERRELSLDMFDMKIVREILGLLIDIYFKREDRRIAAESNVLSMNKFKGKRRTK